MRFLTFAFFLLALPALAEDRPTTPATPPPRTVDMTVDLLGTDGKPVVDMAQASEDDRKHNPPTCAKCGYLTLGHAILYSLDASFEDERNLAGDQKWARGLLAERIKDDRAAALTAKEVTVILRCVSKNLGPLFVAQIYPLLDPNAKPPELQ